VTPIVFGPAPITRRGPGDLVSDDSLRPRDHAEAIALFRAEVVGALAHRDLERVLGLVVAVLEVRRALDDRIRETCCGSDLPMQSPRGDRPRAASAIFEVPAVSRSPSVDGGLIPSHSGG